jgi:hypothetical protein
MFSEGNAVPSSVGPCVTRIVNISKSGGLDLEGSSNQTGGAAGASGAAHGESNDAEAPIAL